jgi:hypothetical protein
MVCKRTAVLDREGGGGPLFEVIDRAIVAISSWEEFADPLASGNSTFIYTLLS